MNSIVARRLALLAFAASMAIGPFAHADFVFNGKDGSDWFDGNNWYNTFGDSASQAPSTGTVPDTTEAVNINTGVTGSVALFDPANQIGNPNNVTIIGSTSNHVYVSSSSSGPGSSGDPNFAGESVEPNTLTVASGTLYVEGTYLIAGRSTIGTLTQTGGTLEIDDMLELGQVQSTAGTGIYVYQGGNFFSGFQSVPTDTNPSYPGLPQYSQASGNPGTSPGVRLGVVSGSSGTFVDYNSGPTGSLQVAGFYVAYTTTTTGTVEFHYDNGGVRPIQIALNPNALDSTGKASGGQLSIRNVPGSSEIPYLNLVLDSNPTLTLVNGTEVPQNLGLFSTPASTDIVYTSAASGGVKGFVDSSTGATLLDGATLTRRAPDGYTDTWDISYQGMINYTDANVAGLSADSSIASVTGPNNLLGPSTTGGGSVVLIGVSAVAPVLGDATGDGKVDEADYSVLQTNLGKTVTGGYAAADFNDDGIVNADDFSIYQAGLAEYNAANPPTAPEPAAIVMLAALPMLSGRRRGRIGGK